jgi:hypothetical protein
MDTLTTIEANEELADEEEEASYVRTVDDLPGSADSTAASSDMDVDASELESDPVVLDAGDDEALEPAAPPDVEDSPSDDSDAAVPVTPAKKSGAKKGSKVSTDPTIKHD